jgi:tryptophan synthase alpha chain
VLVADAPMLEAEPFIDAAGAHGIAPVMIAAPNTPGQTLTKIAHAGRGYTYCVARSGVTGTETEMELNHEKLFAALNSHGAPPPILGFGISTPAHVRAALDAGAAGVISGSAVVKLAASDDAGLNATRHFVREMKAATLEAGGALSAGGRRGHTVSGQ